MKTSSSWFWKAENLNVFWTLAGYHFCLRNSVTAVGVQSYCRAVRLVWLNRMKWAPIQQTSSNQFSCLLAEITYTKFYDNHFQKGRYSASGISWGFCIHMEHQSEDISEVQMHTQIILRLQTQIHTLGETNSAKGTHPGTGSLRQAESCRRKLLLSNTRCMAVCLVSSESSVIICFHLWMEWSSSKICSPSGLCACCQQTGVSFAMLQHCCYHFGSSVSNLVFGLHVENLIWFM